MLLSINVKTSKQIEKTRTSYTLACSQTLCFLFEVRRARVIKDKNRGGLACVQTRLYTGHGGFIDRHRKGEGRQASYSQMFNANNSSMDDTWSTFVPYQDSSKEMNNTVKSIMIIFSFFKE